MAKKTANNAIDFSRLFDVKEQLAKKIEEPHTALALATGDIPAQADDGSSRAVETEPGQAATSDENARVIAFRTATAPAIEAKSAAPQLAVEKRQDPQQAAVATGEGHLARASEVSFASASPEKEVLLRIGMTRTLHSRLRASAALKGIQTTAYVRGLLEDLAPTLPEGKGLEELARLASAAAPIGSAGQRRVEMRMQVPATEALHRRLLQFAALRSQTLLASLIDLLDAQVPVMHGGPSTPANVR